MASDRLRRDSKGIIVLLDTSAIIMLFEFSINLDSELTKLLGKYILYIPKPVIEELNILSLKGKGKKKQYAKASLKLIKKYDIIDDEFEGKGDDAIVDAAAKYKAIVLTNDKELRKRLKKQKLKSIFLRSKNHLVLEEL
jgi:rRNA-processing protein FCF1